MKPSIFEKEYWENRPFTRGRSTEAEIRENQRKNRLQRERDERAYQNDNSTASDGHDIQDKDKS
jgi:hypothetical protein